MQNLSLSTQTFDFYSLRFDFLALGCFPFPPILSANILRGAFGLALQQASPGAYRELFAAIAAPLHPSGLANPPRPFVFRTRHLDGATVNPGETFHIGMNVFTHGNLTQDLIATLAETFEAMGHTGFGPQRSRARFLSAPCPQWLSLPISAAVSVERLHVDFLTPTELKTKNETLEVPLFTTLLCRSRDRISTLRSLYASGPLEIDFEALSARAESVQLTRSEVHHVHATRRSSRTRQTHPLGGFMGFAEYAGDLSEFLPYLEMAAYTGVGRQTVWGKGEIASRVLA